MQEKEIKYKGGKLFYRLQGEGPAVMLVHGFGEDGSIWSHQWDALPGYRLLIPDLPGSGKSILSEDVSMEGLADTLHYLLQNEGISTCTVIGHSMGGYVALAFAERHGHLLQGLGLFHSTAYADSEEKKKTRQKGIEFIEKWGAVPFLQTTIPNLYSSVTKEQQPNLIEAHLKSAEGFQKAALICFYQSMMQRPDRVAVLKQNKLPVLFVLGRYDTAVPLQDGLQQAHQPAWSYVHILEQSGHMGMCEEPEKSNELLREFLSSITLALKNEPHF